MERLNYYDKDIGIDRKALKEVYVILQNYEDGIEAIPEKYMWVIEDNMDKDYDFTIDDIENKTLKDETEKILTYVYTEYLATEEEKEVIKKMIELEREQKQKVKYDVDIFKNKPKEIKDEETIIEEQEGKMQIVEYKENIFTKIIRFIKNIFRR